MSARKQPTVQRKRFVAVMIVKTGTSYKSLALFRKGQRWMVRMASTKTKSGFSWVTCPEGWTKDDVKEHFGYFGEEPQSSKGKVPR